MSKTNLEKYSYQLLDNGVIRFYNCGNCFIQIYNSNARKLLISTAYKHTFKENCFIVPYAKALIIEENPKLKIHEMLENEVHIIEKDIPHQMIVSYSSLVVVTEGNKAEIERSNMLLDKDLVKKARENGMFEEIEWLNENKNFMKTINSR